MSFIDKKHVHRSLETSHSYSSYCGGSEHRYFYTRQSYSHKRRVYHSTGVYIGRSISQEISHSFSHSQGTGFDVEGRGGYISHTSHSSSHNPGDHGRLLTSPVSSNCVEKLFMKKRGVVSVMMMMIMGR